MESIPQTIPHILVFQSVKIPDGSSLSLTIDAIPIFSIVMFPLQHSESLWVCSFHPMVLVIDVFVIGCIKFVQFPERAVITDRYDILANLGVKSKIIDISGIHSPSVTYYFETSHIGNM